MPACMRNPFTKIGGPFIVSVKIFKGWTSTIMLNNCRTGNCCAVWAKLYLIKYNHSLPVDLPASY